jgi:DNA-binding transcriptional LysR family regulator
MVDRLAALETFVRVVEAKSFTAAARTLGSSQSRVSKAIAALEARLGARLIARTTRHLTLTPAGSDLYLKARAILVAVEEAEAAVRADEIGGRLKVNTSAMLALPLVQPALLAFKAAHPALRIELVMDDRRIDPVEEGVDLIVRVGELDDSRLVARRAGAVRYGFYATPRYLAATGQPDTLEALATHSIIGIPERRGTRAGDITRIAFSRDITVSNMLLAHGAALEGAGIAALPRFLAEPSVIAGDLVVVLPGIPLPEVDISFLHPFGQEAPAKIRAFMDFAIARWKGRGELV